KPSGVILRDPDVRNLWISSMREIAAVGQAAGIGIGEADVETAAAGAHRFPPGTSSSLLADTLRKQRTEVELLQGHLVRLAAKLGVDVPISRALYALLKAKTVP
ncbi:MAG TPA: ketopantoate reductase C-terminal domain-containing protein, partial [Acidobacteriota bacterium]|nr:ketopantoate reductase C-terminal domain-containing protein [Acidobacteriota bacterium]